MQVFICKIGRQMERQTRSIWKMLGPFATASRLTPTHQVSPMEWAQKWRWQKFGKTALQIHNVVYFIVNVNGDFLGVMAEIHLHLTSLSILPGFLLTKCLATTLQHCWCTHWVGRICHELTGTQPRCPTHNAGHTVQEKPRLMLLISLHPPQVPMQTVFDT